MHVENKQTPVETYYDERSSEYDSDFEEFAWKIYDTLTWKYLQPYLHIRKEAIVLDAGGGTGRWSIPMAQEGCQVHLIDLSQGMLSQAKRKVEQNGLQDRVIVRKADITSLPYPEDTFDLVFADQVLFIFENKDEILQEFHRVLRKGGVLIVSVPNRYVMSLIRISENPKVALQLLQGRIHNKLESSSGTRVDIHRVTPDELIELCTRNGFTMEKVIGKLFTMPVFLKEEISQAKSYSQEYLDEILEIETELCEKKDALGLAQTLQLIARKP
jgi:ubiquinone/menaquinone biosynthesis C-methylase UbiE